MHCFNHPDTPALGTCKACCKGLCAECTTDMDHGLACKDKHEAMVEAYQFIIDKNSEIYSAAPQNILITSLFYLFMGGAFSFYGYRSGGVTDLPFMLGIGFIVFAVVTYIRSKALFTAESSKA
ncbi:hypothetical protein LRS11_14765 [Pseudomonas sp. J452]|uniref:hypothetical protein n=1 Tax=Pseudomonas sp. J452 TaxID=2898441 RepID=UPI0021AD528A|nr:hypothetical protein [Pseudomonas sp. J452]UUY07086.1 hypothetical protein LRS11_14765 [Pseudomonas sp. J452]